jgi:hypothetical protein
MIGIYGSNKRVHDIKSMRGLPAGAKRSHFIDIGLTVSYSNSKLIKSEKLGGFCPLQRDFKSRVPSGANFCIASASIEHVGQLFRRLPIARSSYVTLISGVERFGKLLQTEHMTVGPDKSA